MQNDDFDNYICGLEALEILRPASDYLLRMAASGLIDLNKLARFEYQRRLHHRATESVAAIPGRPA